jgi:hypothetical protein
MAGEPQRVVLSIQCWHSGTVAVLMFLSKVPVERGGRFGCGCWLTFN